MGLAKHGINVSIKIVDLAIGAKFLSLLAIPGTIVSLGMSTQLGCLVLMHVHSQRSLAVANGRGGTTLFYVKQGNMKILESCNYLRMEPNAAN